MCSLNPFGCLQVKGSLPPGDLEDAPQSPEDVLCLTVPFNKVDSTMLSEGLTQYSHLCMLGLQNTNLSYLDAQVRCGIGFNVVEGAERACICTVCMPAAAKLAAVFQGTYD